MEQSTLFKLNTRSLDQTSETEKVLQKQKYDEIIQLLLSAGYFRARINTLSEFDKVVGGLCWCITSTGEDVDVDILFQENSTIGQKIALSEAITKALRKMNCPDPLQPHQIQGGVGGADYPAIYPVIIWLVKKFFERREELEEQLRSFAILQFSKNYQLSTENVLLSSEFNGNTNTNTNSKTNTNTNTNTIGLLSRNKASRTYRRKPNKGESEEKKVHSCLLEYGEKFVLSDDNSNSDSSSDKKSVNITFSGAGDLSFTSLAKIGASSGLSGFEKELVQAAKEAERQEQLFAEHASKEEAELMKQMSQVGDGAVVTGSQVGTIVGMGSSEIGSAAAAYQAEIEEARKALDSTFASGKLGQAAGFKRHKQNLIKQKEDIELKAAEVQIGISAMIQKLRLIEEERDGSVDYNNQLKGHIIKLNELEGSASQQEELQALKRLVGLNESLRAQEAAFKASCKSQVQEYQAMIKAFDETETENTEENRKLKDIEEMHAKVLCKYNKLRQVLAETNLEIANTSRAIDDVPTRSELIQYERRFVELYSQVAWKLEETKKYYDMYNTLDTTLENLQKEVKILNSISENFQEAMKSSQTKTEFLHQVENIVKSVDEKLTRQESLVVAREKKADELKATHQQLVDEQRRYFKAVKDFQDECNKNEWLTQKLEALARQ